MVHLLFGSPATCERPVALRPRLATGLPLSIGPAGVDGDRRQQATALPARPARGLLGWVRTVPRFGGAASARGAAAANWAWAAGRRG